MGNPNPFYRFKQAWNAGFYPDNQIMTDLINEMVGQLTIDLPSIYPGKTIDALYYAIKQWVKPYQSYPYYGKFDFSIQKIPDMPISEFNINVICPDMATLNLQGSLFTINGFYNSTTKLVLVPNINSFTPGSFSGSFAEPLINEEIRVSEALEVVNINGSAIFPITYSFDPISNVATSGLARGDNWFIDGNGKPDRQPVPNLPYENRRTFELPQLTGDDKYVISVFERIIQASLNDDDYITSILAEYNKYTTPEGWTRTIARPAFTSYDRVQVVFTDPNRRRFTLVGRLDGQWLWQRFVSDDTTSSAYNFLSVYPENVALPFEPNQAGRWLYNDNTYDFEFVEFTSGCYVSPEFYAMPAKPGDQFQFSVTDGNLTGIDSVKVGLFKEDGEFIQEIGEAIKPNRNYLGLGMYGFTGVRGNYVDWYDGIYNPAYSVNFQFIDCNGTLVGNILATIPPFAITSNNFNDFKNLVESLYWDNGITVEVFEDETGFVSFLFDIPNTNQCYCGITAWTLFEESEETIYFIKNEPYSQIVNSNQFQANVTIPALKGCYRMGLYNEPSSTCDMTFEYTLSGSALTDYLTEINTTIFESANPYVSWLINNPKYVYTVTSSSTTANDILEWCNANIPGMVVTSTETSLTFTWSVNDLPCGELYGMSNCHSDSTGDNCLAQLWTTGDIPCECGTSYSLYSLSNIINIDASDCFSTMLEYWGENNSIAQGIEYFNNWKQKIRIGLNGGGEKPMIEESLYRQSNGVHRRPQNKQDLSLDLHTDFLDLDTQLALVDATRHPYLIWEGKSIFVKGDIEVATTQDFTTQSSFETLSQVKFQALVQGFQPKNSTCLTC